ncbi:MAG: Nitrogen permease regulator 3 [Sclerophora amabilis]|nr:MAG: Nitrogen permease regulator 3 [Sclerophora amabilis]
MSPTLLPNPSLVAVLLVVNTKSGPRFVFHYPPNARERVQPTATTWKDPFGDSLWEKGSEPSDPEDGSDDDEPDPHSSGTHQNGGVSISKAARARNRRDYEPDDQGDSSDDAQPHKVEGPAWESLFGFSTAGLEHILRVHKGFNKKKFELGVEPLVYLSYPLFMSEDGTWKKKRDKKAKKSKGKHDPVQRASFGSRDQAEASNKRKSTESRVDVGRLDNDLREMSLYDDPANEEDADDGQSVSSSEDVRAMSMFNMVFVMNPPQLEYQTRIDEMYEHVVKKFAKALKYEQARTNWVWQQSEMILNLKDKAKEDGEPVTWSISLT